MQLGSDICGDSEEAGIPLEKVFGTWGGAGPSQGGKRPALRVRVMRHPHAGALSARLQSPCSPGLSVVESSHSATESPFFL